MKSLLVPEQVHDVVILIVTMDLLLFSPAMQTKLSKGQPYSGIYHVKKSKYLTNFYNIINIKSESIQNRLIPHTRTHQF